MSQQPTPEAASSRHQQQQHTAPWPFPPSAGPIAWTDQQIAENARQQREQIGGGAAVNTAKFTHTPQPPQIIEGYGDMRYFIRHSDRRVLRFANENHAKIMVESVDGMARLTQHLMASECEELARALLDAAHDLRTHKAFDLMADLMCKAVEGSEA